MSSRHHSRREFVKRAAAVGGATSLAGCIVEQVDQRSGTVVQLVADSAAQELQGEINDALHEAGLSSDVSLEILALAPDTTQQQLSQWLSAGLSQPSLMRMDSGWTLPFILREHVVNLSRALPEVARQVTENYFEASVATATGPGGDLYGVPLFSDFGLMLYRRDLVRDAGYDPDGWQPPLSWQRFSEIAKGTAAETGTSYGFTFQARVYEGLSCCNFYEFMTSWGGSYFGDRKNVLANVGDRPVTTDSDPVRRALRMGRTFINGPDDPRALDGVSGPIAPEAVLQWEEDSSLSAFTNGDAVMHRNWPYSILESGSEDAFGTDLGVMPIPRGVAPENAAFEGMGGSRSALGGYHVTLNPNAAHRSAALEVLRAMTADSFYLSLMELVGYVPPKPALLDSSAAQDIDVMGRYLDTLKFAGQRAVPRPVSVVWPQQSPRISQQVSAGLSGDQTPRRALSELTDLLTQIENAVERPQS